jgi:hypothetical protein
MVFKDLSKKVLESNNLLVVIVLLVVAIAAVERERLVCSKDQCDVKQRNIRIALVSLDIALLLAILPIAGSVIDVLVSKKKGYKDVSAVSYVLLAVVLVAASLYVAHLVNVAQEL